MVSLTEIAQAWGTSISYVSKLKQKGMPQETIEGATEWREANRERPPKGFIAPPAGVSMEDSEAEAGGSSGSDLLRDDIYGCLARSKQSEKVAYALLHQAQANRDHARLPNLVKAHREALRGRLDAEMKVESLQRATGAVIGTDLARSIMSRYMSTIRNLMEGLPSSLCRRANPTDPELAKEVITEGIEKVIAVIHKTKGSFGETKMLDEKPEKEVKLEDEQEK